MFIMAFYDRGELSRKIALDILGLSGGMGTRCQSVSVVEGETGVETALASSWPFRGHFLRFKPKNAGKTSRANAGNRGR